MTTILNKARPQKTGVKASSRVSGLSAKLKPLNHFTWAKAVETVTPRKTITDNMNRARRDKGFMATCMMYRCGWFVMRFNITIKKAADERTTAAACFLSARVFASSEGASARENCDAL
jgi:hypothetical protein